MECEKTYIYEDDLPEMTDAEYDKWFKNSWVDFVRMGPLPCSHPGCCHHVTHPCEMCGRVACEIHPALNKNEDGNE